MRDPANPMDVCWHERTVHVKGQMGENVGRSLMTAPERSSDLLEDAPRRVNSRLGELEQMMRDVQMSICKWDLDGSSAYHARPKGDVFLASSDFSSDAGSRRHSEGTRISRPTLPAPEVDGLKEVVHQIREFRMFLLQSKAL